MSRDNKKTKTVLLTGMLQDEGGVSERDIKLVFSNQGQMVLVDRPMAINCILQDDGDILTLWLSGGSDMDTRVILDPELISNLGYTFEIPKSAICKEAN